jgi:hypothetical protein
VRKSVHRSAWLAVPSSSQTSKRAQGREFTGVADERRGYVVERWGCRRTTDRAGETPRDRTARAIFPLNVDPMGSNVGLFFAVSRYG